MAAGVLLLACQLARAQATLPAADTQPSSESNEAPFWMAPTARTATARAKPEANQSGWLSLGTTIVETHGNAQEFRQHEQIDDHLLYGVRDLGYWYKEDGWLVGITGRAMQPWDYGASVGVSKRGVGFLEGTFSEYPSYYNSSRDFYNFAPRIYTSSRDLLTTRMDSNVRGGWYVDKDTILQVRTSYWEKNGDFPALAGGAVVSPAGVTRNRFPDFHDIDQNRERIGTDIIRRIGRFELKLSLDATDFDGVNEVLRPSYLKNGAISQNADYRFAPNFNELMPKIQFSGDLVEKVLRVEYEGLYGWTRSNSDFDRQTFDANVLSVTFGRPTGTTLRNNRSDVTENETEHDLRLVYTPSDRLKIFGGFGFKYVAQDGDSILNSFSEATQAFTLQDHFDTADRREIFTGNIGAEYKINQWLIASADARVEHGDLQRNWNGREINVPSGTQTASAKNNFLWLLDEASDRYEYGAALTAKPTRDLKFVLRWKETRMINDYDTDVLTNNGVPADPTSTAPSELRALIGDNNRIQDEWSILTQYKPSSYFEVTYKLAAKVTSYQVGQDDPRPNTAGVNDLSNSLRLTIRPVDKLAVTVYGSVDDYDVLTAGRNDPRLKIPTYNDNFITWGIEPTVELTKWCTLGAGFCQRWSSASGAMAETGADTQPYRAIDTYVGAVFKINKNWSADCRYTFSWWNETDNGGVNDFNGSMFSVGATARF
jgi:hypothetical protein